MTVGVRVSPRALRRRGAGIKGERVQAHISFSLRSRAIASLQSVCKTSLRRALVLRRVSGGRCPVLLFLCGHAATSPRRFSAPKRDFFQLKEQI